MRVFHHLNQTKHDNAGKGKGNVLHDTQSGAGTIIIIGPIIIIFHIYPRVEKVPRGFKSQKCD